MKVEDAVRDMPKLPYGPLKPAYLAEFLRGLDARLRPAVAELNRRYDKEFTK